MTNYIEEYGSEIVRNELKSLIQQCNDSHIDVFKRMYSRNNLDIPINQVIDTMPVDKLNWALDQVRNTIRKINKIV